MSNMFKSSNNNYSRNNNASYSNSSSRNNYFLNKNVNTNKNKSESTFTLKEEMFPQLNKKEDILVNNQIPLNINIKNNFSTLFKKNDTEEKEIEVDSVIEKDGWITLKKKITYTKNLNQKKESEMFEEEEEEKEKEKELDPRIVFEKLTKLYEKWKKNYIELWGYDDYEKYYRFPNYDYSYLESESDVIEEEETFME